MIKMLIWEGKKYFTIKTILLFSLSVFILSFIFGTVEKSLTAGNPPVDFAAFIEMNRTFILIKIIFPVMISYLVNIMFAGEYESGLMKNFLIYKGSRTAYLLCKIVIAMLCAVFTIIIILLSLMINYKAVWGGELQSVPGLIKTAFEVFPIVSATALVSVISSSFTHSVFISTGMIFLSFSIDSVIGENIITPTSFMSFGNLFMACIYGVLLLFPTIIIFNIKDIWQ
jgi:ABC-type transport system involved in multi-copper enzyme maturation permease subunit